MPTPTDEELTALSEAFDAFSRRYKLADALSSGTLLNELDKQVLLYVAQQPGSGPSDVARFLGVPATTLSSATDRLVKRGLLERGRPSSDRRAVSLQLSATGTRQAESLLTAHRALYRRMLEPLSPEERAALLAIVTKIVLYDP